MPSIRYAVKTIRDTFQPVAVKKDQGESLIDPDFEKHYVFEQFGTESAFFSTYRVLQRKGIFRVSKIRRITRTLTAFGQEVHCNVICRVRGSGSWLGCLQTYFRYVSLCLKCATTLSLSPCQSHHTLSFSHRARKLIAKCDVVDWPDRLVCPLSTSWTRRVAIWAPS